MLLVTVSVAVTVWLPAVLSVTENVPVPPVRVALAGRTAWASVLVKCAVPAYPVAVFPYGSLAVTVTPTADPAVAEAGAETVKRVAAAGLTLTAALVPEMLPVVVSVAVTVRDPAVLRVTVNVCWPLSAAVNV